MSSHLSEEIQRQLSSLRISQAELSRRANISQAQISNWLNAVQTSISAAQIDALASALSADPVDHATLLVAHLQDEKFGQAAALVRIEMDTPAELQDRPRPRTKGERALQYLAAQRLISRDVNELLIDLAKVLGAEV
jgi:transcriptional regulator with XRE-family HTH domain